MAPPVRRSTKSIAAAAAARFRSNPRLSFSLLLFLRDITRPSLIVGRSNEGAAFCLPLASPRPMEMQSGASSSTRSHRGNAFPSMPPQQAARTARERGNSEAGSRNYSKYAKCTHIWAAEAEEEEEEERKERKREEIPGRAANQSRRRRRRRGGRMKYLRRYCAHSEMLATAVRPWCERFCHPRRSEY